ncbi:MAG: PilZ domain-containing protein [Kofleriaceae bacterium]
MAENRRSSTRHAVSIVSKLVVNDASIDSTIMNLSLGGAQIAATTRYPMGARGHVTFRVPTMEDPIAIGVTVRWADGKNVGIQFDGLRARDVWALNEYFKQLQS